MVDLRDLLQQCNALRGALKDQGIEPACLRSLDRIRSDIRALVETERGRPAKQPLPELLIGIFGDALRAHGISFGRIAEIGGAQNSLMDRFETFEINYLSLFPSADPRFIVADISNCPHVPDASFDGIYSISVLEHVGRIHDAAREIVRLLKPGGITLHAVPFSYFFHNAPADYWRLTTTAFETLFEELQPLDCFFYNENRRRNNLGSRANPVDQAGGPKFAPDAFGGWRENWFTVYVGRKLPNGAELLRERRMNQAVVDIVKVLTDGGMKDSDAISVAQRVSDHISFDEDGRVSVSRLPAEPLRLLPDRACLQSLWLKRGRNGFHPSPNRHNLMALLCANGLIER